MADLAASVERDGDELELADWRRSVAELYADVRRLATDDVRAAFDHWRAVRERLFREHPQSPVRAAERSSFRAHHFEFDPALRFEVVVEPAKAEQTTRSRSTCPSVPVGRCASA